jgi:hypothetical protein
MLLFEDTLAASNLAIGPSPSPSASGHLMTLSSAEDGVSCLIWALKGLKKFLI